MLNQELQTLQELELDFGDEGVAKILGNLRTMVPFGTIPFTSGGGDLVTDMNLSAHFRAYGIVAIEMVAVSHDVTVNLAKGATDVGDDMTIAASGAAVGRVTTQMFTTPVNFVDTDDFSLEQDAAAGLTAGEAALFLIVGITSD